MGFILLHATYTLRHEAPLRAGHFISKFNIPANIFKPGIYTWGMGAAASTSSWIWGSDVAALDFSESLGGGFTDRNSGVVGIPYTARRIQQDIMSEGKASALQ